MKIHANPTHIPTNPAFKATPPKANGLPDKFDPDTMEKGFKEPYESWVPLANAAVVGGAVGACSLLGAAENALLGAGAASAVTAFLTPVVAGVGVGIWAGKSAYEEFNGHPILTGLSAIFAGGVAAVAAPIAKMPGAAFGWTGAAVATGVTAAAAGGISAWGIHKENREIAHHNKLYAEWLKQNPEE